MKEQRRVVITGLGLLSPLGNSFEELHQNIAAGKSGTRFMEEWESLNTGLSTKVAAPVGPFDESGIERKYRRNMSRIAIMSVLATQKAIIDSQIPPELVTNNRTGVSYGSCMGGISEIARYFRESLLQNLADAATATTFLKIMPHTCAANIAITFKIPGRIIASSTACAASTQNIGFAYESIKFGIMDRMFAGGAEELSPAIPAIFDVLGATSNAYNHKPHLTPKPFDRDREGIVVGEGAGTFLLEEREIAIKRGAKIYGEVVGFNTCNDGNHPTTPSVEGLCQTMQQTLENAGLVAGDIDYINAHATATDAGDLAEGLAISKVFDGLHVPVNSLKGHFGHLMGATGIIETIAGLAMMRDGVIYPTLNLEHIDERIQNVNIITQPLHKNIRYFMKNSFAFGGVNASLIIANHQEVGGNAKNI